MYKKIKKFLNKCENICLETIKKSSVSSAEAVNSLYGVLTENEDPSLATPKLTKEEKNTLIEEYQYIFINQDKNIFWNRLNSCISLATV